MNKETTEIEFIQKKRVVINTPLYYKMVNSVQHNLSVSFDGVIFKIFDAKRLERTDIVEFFLKRSGHQL